jgi:hypothetical protein
MDADSGRPVVNELWEILGTLLVGREVARESCAVWLRVETRGAFDPVSEVCVFRYPINNVRPAAFRREGV